MNDSEVDFIRRYTSDVSILLRRVEPVPILAAISAIYAAWQAGKVVLFCGNGGSGASCSHIVNDFQKGCGLKAICLNDSMPLVSAWANDECWENVFRRQVNVWGESGGVLVAASGSGNSSNVTNAVADAIRLPMAVIGLSAKNPVNRMTSLLGRDNDSISIHIPTDSMQQAEDVHMVILHMLYLGLQRRIKKEQGVPL